MPEISENQEEEWRCRCDGVEYVLNKDQAALLQEAIANGHRGLVTFKDFALNVPMITVFYLMSRRMKKSHQLAAGASEPVKVISRERLDNIRKDLIARGILKR